MDLKDLWSKQSGKIPDANELLKKISGYKNAHLRKIIITNILFIATSAFIVFIWIKFQPQYITTKIGIILTILAMVIFLFAYNQLVPFLRKTNNLQNNKDYLNNLIALKLKQHHLQSKMLSLYFIMLSAGLGLYLYESTSKMTLFWMLFTYTITGAWVLFNWFYTRPRQIKKQQAKIDEIITRFQEMNNQLEE